MTKHVIVPCNIRIGSNGVKHPPSSMDKYEPNVDEYVVGADGHTAVCRRCSHELDRYDLLFQDLTKISCSNCYSDSITLTSIRFELHSRAEVAQ